MSAGRLVVVSNRLPLTLRHGAAGWRAEPSSGGLVTALEPVLQRSGGLWVGWHGEPEARHDPQRDAILAGWEQRGYASVDLTPEIVSGFYHGFSNSALWPVLHHFPARFAHDAGHWPAYAQANREFCEALVPRLRPDDLVWVHDYHLMLLPSLLRRERPELAIGFFLHIPFPPPDLFRVLPRREELLQGLLGADLVAFQTYGHLQHFRSSLLRILGVESRMDHVDVDGRRVRLGALPIGIVPQSFTDPLERDPATATALAELRRRYDGQRILLAVDRLDYTKGIPERLRTYRRLLEAFPAWRGKVVLIQVAVPSRERVSHYRQLRHEVNSLVGEINGAFGTPEWMPVVYIRRSVPRATLVALYAAADVGWVTPLRDGMNLVAKEYVACQAEDAGVLLLSEFAGAAAEMGEALHVNPYDEERTAAALARALEMPPAERRERLQALRRRVARNTAVAWSERFVSALRSACASRDSGGPGKPLALPGDELVAAWRAQRPRLVMLDHEGALAPAGGLSDADREEVAALLGRLCAAPATRVAIVSGRPARELDRWFGDVPGLYLAAEHGALLHAPDRAGWTLARPHDRGWKDRVQPILDEFVDRTPGSFVEELECALIWDYGPADPEFGEWLANELTATLDELLAATEARAVRGRKTVEVRLSWAHEGAVAEALRRAGPAPAFELAFGGSRTPEGAFAQLPASAWTVQVGVGRSGARYALPDAAAVRRLVERLVAEAA